MISSHRFLYAAALAVPLGLLALAGWLNYRQVRADAQHQAERTAQALGEHAHRTLRAQELILRFVDRYAEGRSWRELVATPEAHRLFARLAEGSDDVSSIFMLDPEGQMFVSSRQYPMPRIDASDRDYYRALRARDELYIGAPARGRLGNDRFFSVARRRTQPDQGFDGLISVSVNPQYFESFYASLLDPSQAASLVRADGTLLARHPPGSEALSVLPPGSAFTRAIAARPVAGAFVTRSLNDGIDRMIAYHKVGTYPVYASFQLSMASVWGAWGKAMLPYSLACVLAMGLLLAGVAFGEQRTRRAAAEARTAEAEAASRAKDLFVAALSHELRNPLAAISNAAEALQRQSGSPLAVQIILRQIAQLRRMLDDLLDTARAVYGKLKLHKRRVDLGAIAESVLAEQLPGGQAVGRLHMPGGDAWVDGDPVRLRQMLDNLVDNAVKYGGRHIDIAIEAAGDWVQVAVKDDGDGIAPDLLPRLFQPFVQGEQTIERAQGGLGLGLALVNRLVALHGGSLAAASEGAGRGATFTLRLPRADAPARRVELAVVAAGNSRRLLVVEDEPDARESLRTLLELEGHRVAVAGDSAAALEALAQFAPDAALVDIGLPGMDGYELARHMRAASDRVILIAVTGYGQREDRERARLAGFAAHLTKPFSYDELMRALADSERRAAA